MFARQPAGFAFGALSGSFPTPGLGLPAGVGPFLHDDFIKPSQGTVAGRHGDLLWPTATITGAPSYSSVTPTSAREFGILRQVTIATINTGGTFYFTPGFFYRYPPPGVIWSTKVRVATAADNLEYWSGFSSAINTRVRPADTTQFVGIRYHSAVSNNFLGVVKNSAGETVLDLGISALTGAYSSLGFEVSGTLSAPVFTFFVLNEQVSASLPPVFDRRDIGSITPATLPTAPLLAIGGGVFTTIAGIRGVEIDSWSCGGLCAR